MNVDGTHNILKSINTLPNKPWIIYASSREVYGQQLSCLLVRMLIYYR